jgi:CheY-like chemotaxis protein
MYMPIRARAFVVDGDALSLHITSSILKTLQIEYKRNTTGRQVMEQVLEASPDFILINLSLPEADPLMILKALQSNPRLKHLPVIAIVDDDTLAQLLPDIEAGQFAGYLTKPFARKDLLALLDTVLH